MLDLSLLVWGGTLSYHDGKILVSVCSVIIYLPSALYFKAILSDVCIFLVTFPLSAGVIINTAFTLYAILSLII